MRVGIVGLGLIGGSLGQALRQTGHEVVGFDLDVHASFLARQMGCIDRKAASLADLRACELIILAAPPGAIISTIPEVARELEPGTIITDVCSVKRPVVAAMNELPRGARGVGGHPIAGKAVAGIENANADIFRGAAFAVVPTSNSDRDAMEAVASVAAEIGSTPIVIEADEHDRVLASASHLPQLLSSVLSAHTRGSETSGLGGPGLQSMLRLAGSDAGLWAEILELNGDMVADSLESFIGRLTEILPALREGRGDELEAVIRAGRLEA